MERPVENEHSFDSRLLDTEYDYAQIIGLYVVSTRGERIGTVTNILKGQSNDNYVVQGREGEILVPAIEDVVRSIDLKNRCITIEAIDGLLDLNSRKPRK